MSFPHYHQLDAMDCGPTCLRMIAKYYGRSVSLQQLRNASGYSREGVSFLGIAEAAEEVGFKTLGVKITLNQLLKEVPLPCIVHWQQNHFVVVTPPPKHGIFRRLFLPKQAQNIVSLADPGKGLRTLSQEEFVKHWANSQENGQPVGLVLLLEPTPDFFNDKGAESFSPTDNPTHQEGVSLRYFFQHLWQYKKLLFQLLVGLLVGSGLQLVFPFLTQSIVDIGIQARNLHFIYVILGAQIMLFASRTVVEFIRSWILLHISIRINLSILSDFLIKLMKLPMSFFDTKMFGDIMQRINDHTRIEQFLTGPALNTLFSFINLLLFGVVLALYNLPIFLIFLLGSVLYGAWVVLFLKERRKLDFRMFDVSSKKQSSLVQLIQGMQEIKLANAEKLKRWEWERIQTRMFRFQSKALALNQYQHAGAVFLNEGKNIIITFLAAKAVVEGQMTLGTMLAIQYILGQLNSPIESLIQFIQAAQSAKISLERLNEIHQMKDDRSDNQQLAFSPKNHLQSGVMGIVGRSLTFAYPGAGNAPVLKNMDFVIPKGKITAIVGTSGSGKTTLLKLLLKFYNLQNGHIHIDGQPFEFMDASAWRSNCGVVMQDGFIFSDNIAQNIALGDENPNVQKLHHACQVANIMDYIYGLPLGMNTQIGAEGNGISQGQKQRLLIARAVYKDPEYLFFDEATNALDANNERVIMQNLEQFFKGRTCIIVAHRLSTVKNADQIIVVDGGEIAEVGTHTTLTQQRGKYFELVKNQLELGN